MRILTTIILTTIMIALMAGRAAAEVANPLGTAGPFRSVGGAKCEAGFVQQFAGACDPPAVDTSLPSKLQSKAHVERAVKLISLIRMEQAKQSLDAAVAADPGNVQALTLRARITIPGGGPQTEADINAGLLLDPRNSDLIATRATLYQSRSRMDVALQDANDAVKAKPDNADALWIRASIYHQLNQLERANTDLTAALRIEPDYLRARLLRSNVRMQLGRMEEAGEDATAVLATHPGDASALRIRAMARIAGGDLEGARSDLTLIIGEPGAPATASPAMGVFNALYVQRAMVLVRLGRVREAMLDLDALTRMGGNRAILQMQIYLRGNGFPDIPIDGRRSDLFDDAVKACFIDQACGRGIATRV